MDIATAVYNNSILSFFLLLHVSTHNVGHWMGSRMCQSSNTGNNGSGSTSYTCRLK